MSTEAQINPWVKRGNAIVCALLVVAIAYVLVRIVYLFIDPLANQPAPTFYQETAAQRGGVAKSEVDTSIIPSLNLFGEVGQVATAAPEPQEVNAPKTRLNLELQAVFVAPNEDKSSAMIAESRRNPELYRIGASVSRGVSLAAVYEDRVLLNRNGSMEALYFPESSEGGLTRAQSNARDEARSRTSRRTSSSFRPTDRSPSRRAQMLPDNGMDGMPDDVMQGLQDQVAQDPDAVLSQIGLLANNGRGYKVGANANPMLATLGVKAGDVILEVNGRAVGDPVEDMSFIEQVVTEGSVRVAIERNGKRFETQVALPGM